jgi:hypothetical protein
VPITRYGDASHLVMVDVDGAVQVSSPRPLPTMDVNWEVCADDVAALDVAPTVISDRLAAGDAVGAADPPSAAELDEPEPDQSELDEPEPDTWDLVPDAAVWPVIAAPASMERSPASFVP